MLDRHLHRDRGWAERGQMWEGTKTCSSRPMIAYVTEDGGVASVCQFHVCAVLSVCGSTELRWQHCVDWGGGCAVRSQLDAQRYKLKRAYRNSARSDDDTRTRTAVWDAYFRHLSLMSSLHCCCSPPRRAAAYHGTRPCLLRAPR